ncbi:response regulator [bacterium]|nr:MAG: response regulator [bacterium]
MKGFRLCFENAFLFLETSQPINRNKTTCGITMKVGIIEEDEISLNILKLLSSSLGWEIVYVSNSYQQWLKTPPNDINMPELFLVDLFFSGASAGLAIGTWIRSFTDSKLVYLTTISDAQTLSFARQLNPDAFLNKPIYQSDLLTLNKSLGVRYYN